MSDEWLREATRVLLRQHKAEARFKEGPNLLPNPGFEVIGADGFPTGWTRNDDIGRSGPLSSPSNAKWRMTDAAHSGAKAVTCSLPETSFSALYAEVALKPNTEYRLTGWAKTANFSEAGSASVTASAAWRPCASQEMPTGRSSSPPTTAAAVRRPASCCPTMAKATAPSMDVKFCELIPQSEAESEPVAAGDAKRGEDIFWKHPVAACVNCHMLGGKGSAVGPALDGNRQNERRSLPHRKPGRTQRQTRRHLQGHAHSPMPPMRLI